MADTANLKLPLMEAAQSQKHVTHNEALELLDAIVQLTVLNRTRTTPPAGAADGDRYIIASGATGAWDDKALNIALRRDGAWTFIVPEIGWLAWVQDESRLLAWNGTAWADAIGSLTGIEAIEARSISAGTGLTGGGDLSASRTLALNAASIASLAKADTAVQPARSISAGTGLTGGGDLAANRSLALNAASIASLAKADTAYQKATVVGTVGQSGGVPTGAVIESGSNANGSYVRFADGTQICWKNAIACAYVNAGNCYGTWTLPAALSTTIGLAVTASPMPSNITDNSTGIVNAQALAPPGIGSATLAAVGIRVFRITGATDFTSGQTVHVSAIAIGRWF